MVQLREVTVRSTQSSTRDPEVSVAPLRVLLLTDETTQRDSRSVATRRWTATALSLQASGCWVALGTLRGFGPLNQNLEDAGVDTLSLDCAGYRGIPRAIWRVARYIRRERIDVVHGHEVIPAFVGAVASFVARRGVRVYFRSHTSSSPRHSFVSWLVARMATATMGGSNAVGRYAQRLDRTSPDKVRVAINGVVPPREVSPAEVDALKKELGITASDKVAIVVSRLRAEKGIDTFLRAGIHLPQRADAPVHLVVAGSGPQRTDLEELASSLGLVRVHFVGHQDDVALWYAIADVVVAPSYRDAAPLSVLEAMGCRRAVAASRVGGLREWVVDEQTGLLVDPHDPVALAEAMARLLNDRALQTRMGKAGHERFHSFFTIDRMALDWATTYRELAGRP